MSESIWTAADEGREENRRGYDDQMQWLQGKSIPEARQALAARLATLASSEYNGGGNAATCDYIERLKIREGGGQS